MMRLNNDENDVLAMNKAWFIITLIFHYSPIPSILGNTKLEIRTSAFLKSDIRHPHISVHPQNSLICDQEGPARKRGPMLV